MNDFRRHKNGACRPVALLVVFVAAAAIAAGCSQPGERYTNPGAALPPANDYPSLILGGVEWTEVMSWDFSSGYYPGGWGWGEWTIEDDLLVGDDPDGNTGVYFFPFSHGDNVILETKVRVDRGVAGHAAEVQLLTRDSDFLHYQSGIALFAGANTVEIRHTAGTRDYVRTSATIGGPLGYGRWYIVRFMLLAGAIDAFVDGEHVYSSIAAARAGRNPEPGGADTTGVYPVGTYHQPCLAVRWGEASFEYVRIYRASDTGFERETATAAGAGWGESRARAAPARHWLVTVLLWLLIAVIAVIVVYIVRHYTFTVNRLFGRQRQPYIDIDTADWPEVTVVIPAHNEEVVIAELLEALLDVDYPSERLTIMPVNDRSRDRTGEIIDEFAERHPGLVKPYHRREGTGGKAAALRDATEHVETEIMLVFDADYVPGRGLVKQLVAPFFDPEVGAVMGRVVPYNVGGNLLTRILDLERTGGYQVDQQARMNMRLVPQYGGTVGGVRKTALLSVGNWRIDSLAEDTDATYRLLLDGWKTVYQNRSECYEQVPETWASRLRQISRWAKGHNQVMARYTWSLLRDKHTSVVEKLDGLLLLAVYLMSPLMLFGWTLGIILWYLGEPGAGLVVLLAVTSYSTLGNFAVFFQIAAATHIDGTHGRIRLLPFVFIGFLVSLFSIARAEFAHVRLNNNGKNGKDPRVTWDKTERNNNFNGHQNGRNGYHFQNGRNGGSNDADAREGRAGEDGPQEGPPRNGEGEDRK
jgi:cellulose synthase/poly-beta-1,6-N-acetylglucosamine synthase-like glycosyltransferase